MRLNRKRLAFVENNCDQRVFNLLSELVFRQFICSFKLFVSSYSFVVDNYSALVI